MARVGTFDPGLRAIALLDPTIVPDGWYDHDLIGAAVSGGPQTVAVGIASAADVALGVGRLFFSDFAIAGADNSTIVLRGALNVHLACAGADVAHQPTHRTIGGRPMPTWKTKRGDTRNAVRMQCTRPDGTVVSLAGLSVNDIVFRFYNPRTNESKVRYATAIDDAANGKVSYTPTAADVATDDTWLIDVTVTFPVGAPETFPVEDKFTWIIKANWT